MSSVSCCAGAPKTSRGMGGCVLTKVARGHRVYDHGEYCGEGGKWMPWSVQQIVLMMACEGLRLDEAMRRAGLYCKDSDELGRAFCWLLTVGVECDTAKALLVGMPWAYDQGDRVVSMSRTDVLVGELGSGEYETRWDVEEVYTGADGVQRFEGRRTYGSYEEAARDFLRRVSE